jgi:hypothetical protein
MDVDVTQLQRIRRGLLILAVLSLPLLAYGGWDAEAAGAPAATAADAPSTAGDWSFERGDRAGWHTRSPGSAARRPALPRPLAPRCDRSGARSAHSNAESSS